MRFGKTVQLRSFKNHTKDIRTEYGGMKYTVINGQVRIIPVRDGVGGCCGGVIHLRLAIKNRQR